MTTDSEDTLLEFPCDFPFKIMGKSADDFEALVLGLMTPHVTDVETIKLTTRASRDGNYISLTVTIRAESKVQLDTIYQALTAEPRVLMVL